VFITKQTTLIQCNTTQVYFNSISYSFCILVSTDGLILSLLDRASS